MSAAAQLCMICVGLMQWCSTLHGCWQCFLVKASTERKTRSERKKKSKSKAAKTRSKRRTCLEAKDAKTCFEDLSDTTLVSRG